MRPISATDASDPTGYPADLRRAVIQNAAVKRPCPCPAQRVTRPDGSALSRRAIWLPSGVQHRRKSSSHRRSYRHRAVGRTAKLLAFLDDNRTGCRIGNIGSALPLLSIATSSDFGSCGMGSSRSCSAPGPGSRHPVRHTLAQAQEDTGEDLAISQRNSRASAPFQCHCNQRPELTIEPSLPRSRSMADGTLRSGSSTSNFVQLTVVLPEVRGFSVQRVMVTRNFSFDRQPITLFLFGMRQPG